MNVGLILSTLLLIKIVILLKIWKAVSVNLKVAHVQVARVKAALVVAVAQRRLDHAEEQHALVLNAKEKDADVAGRHLKRPRNVALKVANVPMAANARKRLLESQS